MRPHAGGIESSRGHVKTIIVENGECRCPHCGEEIDVGQFGRGDERSQSASERRKQQSKDRMEDVNESTRPGQVTMADLKERKV